MTEFFMGNNLREERLIFKPTRIHSIVEGVAMQK